MYVVVNEHLAKWRQYKTTVYYLIENMSVDTIYNEENKTMEQSDEYKICPYCGEEMNHPDASVGVSSSYLL